MSNSIMILLVEDEKGIRNFMETALMTQGYKYKEAQTGKEAIALFMSYNPDIIILDLGLPDMDGLEVLKAIRKLSDIPVIIVSARNQEREKVEALDLGADDYLSKPFGISELLARVRVIVRRIMTTQTEQGSIIQEINIGDLKIDLNQHKVTIKDKEIHLTPIEFKILVLLGQHPGKVLTHQFIIKEVWGMSVGGEAQSLRVFMATLRRKIEKNPAEPRYILTEVGVGYRLAEG